MPAIMTMRLAKPRFCFLFVLLAFAAAVSAAEPSVQVLLSPGVAPCTVHVNGVPVVPPNVDPTACTFDWDFGDPRAPFDTLRGFNAAHCFNHAGSYTIRLTFTGPTGREANEFRHHRHRPRHPAHDLRQPRRF